MCVHFIQAFLLFIVHRSETLLVVFRGLLGAHVMADLLKQRGERMLWYRDELLHMAKDLGRRLLPAFNTTSGLPYPRVIKNAAESKRICNAN